MARGRTSGLRGEASEMRLFLEQYELTFYIDVLLDNGYNLHNFDLLTLADLCKLRITNKNDQQQLIGLAKYVGTQKERLEARHAAEAEEATQQQQQVTDGSAADATVSPRDKQREAAALHDEAAAVERHGAKFTATTPTANECCRMATIFIEHHHIDKPWPQPGSGLSQGLNLSTAAKRTTEEHELLYALLLDEKKDAPKVPTKPQHRITQSSSGGGTHRARPQSASRRPHPRHGPQAAAAQEEEESSRPLWNPVNQRKPRVPSAPSLVRRTQTGSMPLRARVAKPLGHKHGEQSRSCPVCEDHIVESQVEGQWQFQVREEVLVGEGKREAIKVWKPFAAIESLKLENAWKKKLVGTRLGAKYADFDAMEWGSFPMRRVHAAAVNFPSLAPSEIVRGPGDTAAEDARLKQEMDNTFRKLLETDEQRARFRIWHEEMSARMYVAAQIRAVMEEVFEEEKRDLEREEERARRLVEDEQLKVELEDLWDKAEESVRKIALDDAMAAADAELHERMGGAGADDAALPIAGTPKTPSGARSVIQEQRDLVSQMEKVRRDNIESQENAERQNLERLILRYNAQVRTMLANKKVKLVASTELRCAKCKKKECPFFNEPWHNHWKHHGGALDLHLPEVGYGTLSALLARATELEYAEFLDASRRDKTRGFSVSPRGAMPADGGTTANATSGAFARSSSTARSTMMTPPPPAAGAGARPSEDDDDEGIAMPQRPMSARAKLACAPPQPPPFKVGVVPSRNFNTLTLNSTGHPASPRSYSK